MIGRARGLGVTGIGGTLRIRQLAEGPPVPVRENKDKLIKPIRLSILFLKLHQYN